MACFFFQAEDGIRDRDVTGVQTCALPISRPWPSGSAPPPPHRLRQWSPPSRQWGPGCCGYWVGYCSLLVLLSRRRLPRPRLADPAGCRALVSWAGVRTGMPEWFNSGMGMFGRGAGAGGGRHTGASADDVMVTELYRQYRGPLLLFVLRLTAGDRQQA